MRDKLRSIIVALVFAASLRAQDARVDAFFRDFTADWVRHDPTLATSARYFTGDEQDRLDRQITPETRAWKLDRIQRARKGLTDLRKFDRARMSATQRVSAELMEWQLDTLVREEPFLDFTFPLEQFNGANFRIVGALTVVHPIARDKDAANYLAALHQAGPRMEEALEEARRLAAKNMFPPRFILEATIGQMRQFIGSPPLRNSFVTTYSQRMAAIGSISVGRREELRSEAEHTVATEVYPAWQKAIALLEGLLDRATDDAGIWRFNAGPQAYAYALRRYTTTDLSADQIHQIGLDQVERIEKQMDVLLRGLGRTEGSVKDRIAQLKKDMSYPLNEEGRSQTMAEIQRILADAKTRSADLFDRVPKSEVIAVAYPAFLENDQAARYSSPAPDGSRPGTFFFPLRPDQLTKFGLRSVVYHETVPGHHFQIALQVENTALPRFRQIGAFGGISALVEGWGLYAERLAAESGWYKDDPEGLLGQLDYELFRARRLVVDTGIHSKHWTRQQAIDYGIAPSEVDRYAIWPGQACSYMIGELKFIELREKAQKALGDKFSLREFHNVVLGAGTVPLGILEQQVDAYIRAGGNI